MIKPGDQIVYIPNHVISLAMTERQTIQRDKDGSLVSFPNTFLTHPNCEFGFVTSVSADRCAFCRFWSGYDPVDLRTKSCSEKAELANLLLVKWQAGVDQAAIDAVCEKYGIEIRRDNDGN